MKKTLIICIPVLAITVLFFACKKDETKLDIKQTSGSGNPANVAARTLYDVEIPGWATPELVRVYNDVKGPDYEIAIIDNANYGEFSPYPENEVYICGATPADDAITVELNGSSFSPRSDGQWFNHGLSWKDYFNKDVSVTIKSGGVDVAQQTIHVPAAHLGSIPLDEQGALLRSNALLTWNPDNNNTLGYVVVHYRLYKDGECIVQDADVVQDNTGSFDFGSILAANPQATEIYFQLIAGNTVSTVVNDHKILFYIATYDHHRFFLK
jgi:hypothetical protein